MESNDQAPVPRDGSTPPGAPGSAPQTPPAEQPADHPSPTDGPTRVLSTETPEPAAYPDPSAGSVPPPGAVVPPAVPPAGDVPPAGHVPPAGSVPPGSVPPPGAVPPGGSVPPGGQYPPGDQFPPPGDPRRSADPRPLVRTREPRVIAGVCGGLGRATNTDPILWRVVLAVLVFFGGIGALLYLLGWLLLPLEGEQASPVEALIGRGQSSTSPVVTVLLGGLTVIALAASLNNGYENIALLLAVGVGVVLLLRRTGTLPESFPRAQPTPAGAGGYQQATASAPGGASTWGGPTNQPYSSPGPVGSGYGSPSYGAPDYPTNPTVTSYTAGTPSAPTATVQSGPTAPPYPPSSTGSGTTGYSSPFAPRGPFEPPRKLPPMPPVPPRPPVQPRPPRPPKQKSILGRVTFAVMCLALAGLAIVDLSGTDVPFSAYPATALGVTALGLLVGAWFGRSRLLILLGIILSLVLGIGVIGEKASDYNDYDEYVLWKPTTIAELQNNYEHKAGNTTLDLTSIDFTDRSANVDVKLGLGDLTVLLPPKVDATVDAKVGVGEAQIFDARSEGLGVNRGSTDNGIDGAGGGTIDLNIEVGVGSLEVSR